MIQKTTTRSDHFLSNKSALTIIALTIMTVIVIAALYISGSPYSLIPVTRPPSTVRVSGTVWAVTGIVTKNGILTMIPTSIKFVSTKTTDQTFTTAVAENGAYSIDLPNQQTFKVIVSWSGKTDTGIEQSGTTDQGTLTVNIGVGTSPTINADFRP